MPLCVYLYVWICLLAVVLCDCCSSCIVCMCVVRTKLCWKFICMLCKEYIVRLFLIMYNVYMCVSSKIYCKACFISYHVWCIHVCELSCFEASEFTTESACYCHNDDDDYHYPHYLLSRLSLQGTVWQVSEVHVIWTWQEYLLNYHAEFNLQLY